MLVNKFSEICSELGWQFNYGGMEWQNLLDLQDDTGISENDGILPENLPHGVPAKVYFLLFYKDREKRFNEFNVLTTETFSGEFVLAERSHLSEKDYNYKYRVHIEKMEAFLDNFHARLSDCEGLHIESWSEVEVTNQLDTNVDGIKVRFRIRHEL